MPNRRRFSRRDFLALARIAKIHTPHLSKQIEAVLSDQIRHLAEEISHGAKLEQVVSDHAHKWQKDLDTVKQKWLTRYAVDGYMLAGSVMGKTGFLSLVESKVLPMAQAKAHNIGFGDEELIANHVNSRVGKWIYETSEIETRTTATRYERIYRDAITGYTDEDGTWRNSTMREIGTSILDAGLADAASRADMMARTMTSWGVNAGANQLYSDEGVEQIEWVTGEDEVTCEWCGEMQGVVVGTDSTFFDAGQSFLGLAIGIDVDHPPLHPNCRCCIAPVV